MLGVGLAEDDVRRIGLGGGDLQHVGIEVGGDDLRVGQLGVKRRSDDAGAGGGLEDISRVEGGDAPGQVARIRLEQ